MAQIAMTISPTEANRFRPWYRLHMTTLLAVLVVGAAVAHVQLQSRGGFSFGGLWNTTTSFYHGWPIIALYRWEYQTAEVNSTPANITYTTTSKYEWSMVGVAIDVVVSLLLIASTVIASERWRRRSCRMWQFSIRSLLMLVTITSLALSFYFDEMAFYWWWADVFNDGSHMFHGGLRLSPWYIVVPIVFSFACAVFAAGWITAASALRLARLVPVCRWLVSRQYSK